MRVVSLNCSNTEIVAALRLEHHLVGVDDDSDFPAELVARLPRVGRDLDVDVAKVSALAPDLVLASDTVPGHDRVIARLSAAGLPTYAPETITLADVATDLREIARRMGEPARGAALAAAFEATLAEARARTERERAAGLPTPRVLLEWWPKPVIVPGARSWVTELIELAGGTNPFGDEPVKSRPVRDDEVVARAPDAAVICWCGVKPEKYRTDVVTGRAAWAATPALRRGAVHAIPEAFLGRPGPRLLEGLAALRGVVEAARGAIALERAGGR
ncbi:MAG: ABC transporter substrate-binding protein [Planctomycetes bacterium]|nr:ABC transporter substrate-binding protein [Planctomycetota bacterium]